MKKMKKITAVWILMAMLAGISGCSKEETPPPAEAEGTTTVTTEAEQKEEPGQVTTGTGSQENVAAKIEDDCHTDAGQKVRQGKAMRFPSRFTAATTTPQGWCRRRLRLLP